MRRSAHTCLALLTVIVVAPLLAATARGQARAPGPDELYWLAPALVEQLSPAIRERLAALASDLVAGRMDPDGIDDAVAQALRDRQPDADTARAWLAHYLSWQLKFLGGELDLAPETLQAIAAAPCCGLGADWLQSLATDVGVRSRVAGVDPAAAIATVLPATSAGAEVLAIAAMADLDRGLTPAAQAQLVAAQEKCAESCAHSGSLLLVRARAEFFAAHFSEATTLAKSSLNELSASPRTDWVATLPLLADLAELLTELKETDAATATQALAYQRSDALLPHRHPYALAVAAADLMASVEDYESNTAAAKYDALTTRFGDALDERQLAVIELRIDEAAMQWLRSEYGIARQHVDTGIASAEQTLGASAPMLADGFIVRALACSGLGDHECVLSDLRRGLALRESIYGFPHPLVAEAQNNLAVNLHDYGRYDLAEPLMKSVVDIDRAYYGSDNEEVASDLHNLASLYRAMGDTAKAIPLLQEALAIDEHELGPRHLRTGIMLNGLGQAYLEAQDWEHAFESFQKSAEIQAAVDPMSRGVPIANHNLATAALELNRPELARDLLEQAIVRYEDPKSLDWRKSTAAHRELARAYAALGRGDDAERELIRAAELAPLANAPEVHWRTFMAIANDDQRRGNERSAVFLGKLALEVLQQMRSTQSTLERPLQADFLKHRADSYRSVVSWLVDLGRLAEAHSVHAMLGQEEYFEFTRRLRAANSTAVPFTAFEREQRDRLQAAWDAVRDKTAEPPTYGTALAQVRADFAALEPAHETKPVLVDLAVPGAHAAYLDYVVDDDRTTVIVLTARGRFSAILPIARSELRARVFELREALVSPGRDPVPLAAALYDGLVAPIVERLRSDDVTTLWVSADDVLRYLPLAALHDGRHYLGERYAVASVSPLAPAERPQAAKTVAAFAVSRPVGGYPALPATEAEVDAIVRTDARDPRGELPGRIWLNEAFDRQGLRDALASGYDVVHVASHFQFTPGNETDSFLLLGTGEHLPLSELRTGDYPLDRVNLLTMSGCDTVAASEDADGREIEGFAALAASKGTRYVLATLWSIDDEATAALMSRFYRALARGQDPVVALAEARKPFMGKHPFYWAPFVIWGTPGA